MKTYIDITRPMMTDMASWPGRPPPAHRWEKQITQGDPCNVSTWEMSAHSGTHMDAPLHFVDGGRPIDEIPADVFFGNCTLVDIDAENDCQGAYRAHGPLLSLESAARLLKEGLVLIGTDRLSVDDSSSDDRSRHHLFLGAGCVIIEGLLLTDLAVGDYSLYAAPLRMTGTEASPIRAYLAPA
jgi:arylformamidase